MPKDAINKAAICLPEENPETDKYDFRLLPADAKHIESLLAIDTPQDAKAVCRHVEEIGRGYHEARDVLNVGPTRAERNREVEAVLRILNNLEKKLNAISLGAIDDFVNALSDHPYSFYDPDNSEGGARQFEEFKKRSDHIAAALPSHLEFLKRNRGPANIKSIDLAIPRIIRLYE